MTASQMRRAASSPLFPADVLLPGLSGPLPPDHLDVGLAGDVLLTEDFLAMAAEQGGVELRGPLWQPLSGCGLVLANLEGPVTEREVPAENKTYNLKTARRALELFDARFVLSLANNHIMDFGPQGLSDTIDALDDAGLAYAGAGRDLHQARAPRYLPAGGVECAVICAADPRFQPATASSPGTFPAIPELLAASIREARCRARFVAVSIHMGLEHTGIPSATQRRLAEACLAAGAHLLQFHHAHCLAGCASDGRGIVLFGTGNYVFPRHARFEVARSRLTAAWKVRYSKQADAVVALGVAPAMIDGIGMPHAAGEKVAQRIRRRIRQCSRRALAPYGRPFWLVWEMLKPGFLGINGWNYFCMFRRRGLRFLCRSLVEGLKVHLAR